MPKKWWRDSKIFTCFKGGKWSGICHIFLEETFEQIFRKECCAILIPSFKDTSHWAVYVPPRVCGDRINRVTLENWLKWPMATRERQQLALIWSVKEGNKEPGWVCARLFQAGCLRGPWDLSRRKEEMNGQIPRVWERNHNRPARKGAGFSHIKRTSGEKLPSVGVGRDPQNPENYPKQSPF